MTNRERTVSREDFAHDPVRWVELARAEGPVTVVDAQGRPRLLIVVPSKLEDGNDEP